MALTNGHLPKTIEGATSRYLHAYETNYRGIPSERKRLRSLAEASIFHMRRKAPNFYENHLPTLINQAASSLLSCKTETPNGSRKFHETHRNLLRVLDELKKTQPDGVVNFQKEVERVQEKDALMKRHLELRKKINELEAAEIDCDDIGSDREEAFYNKVFNELDKLNAEMKKVSMTIAHLENENIDQYTEFKLLVSGGSALERLSSAQQKNLESQIVEYLKQNKNKKKSMYVDKSIIDGMITKLNISHLSPVELNDLSKDALDAYKQHYRNIENERREEFHEGLLSNSYLKPKEGLVLEGPDDLPEDVKQRLDQSDRNYKRKLNECLENYANRPENLDENAAADTIEDDDDTSNDGVELLRIVAENNYLFKRVKEEPRDDYEDEAPSDDEMIVTSKEADEIEASQNRTTHQQQPTQSSTSSPEEFEMLGLVAPTDKIPLIELDDD